MPSASPAALAAPSTGAVTPGTYLRTRREAAGLTLDQVARVTRTDPAVEHRERVAWLRDIEEDRRALLPADGPLVLLLGCAFPFDRDVLAQLVLIHAGADLRPPQLCRLCACSWYDACEGSCAWSTSDVSVCTRCEARMAVAAAAPPPSAGDVAA